jgi:hypothetical protein
MNKIFPILSLSLLLAAANTAHAQTKVIKANALKANDYGVRYTLPKTILTLTIHYSQTQNTAGPYAKYASRYLGIQDADITLEDRTSFTLNTISVEEKGIPDKNQSYLVSFRPKTTAPFLYLTEDGLICTINAEYHPDTPPPPAPDAAPAPQPSNPQSIYTEEYLRAGSISKMAEVAAKSIYRIRESRQDLLTGEIDNVPKDGEAIKIILNTLNEQERLWTQLFTGTSTTQHFTHQITLEPLAEVSRQILFRFSQRLGLLDPDDLAGDPIYYDLKNLKTVPIPTPDPKQKPKNTPGIVYNIPGKATLLIYSAQQKMGETTLNVTQFGATDTLAPELFEDKKSPIQIHFYPNTGAIRQIIQ